MVTSCTMEDAQVFADCVSDEVHVIAAYITENLRDRGDQLNVMSGHAIQAMYDAVCAATRGGWALSSADKARAMLEELGHASGLVLWDHARNFRDLCISILNAPDNAQAATRQRFCVEY